MRIRHFELPTALAERLASPQASLSSMERARVIELLKETETAIPEFYDLEGILLTNRLWESEHVKTYLGAESSIVIPGTIDPARTLIIGQAEPDSPIALDYRTAPPRIVYFGDNGLWIEMFPNYDSLISAISR